MTGTTYWVESTQCFFQGLSIGVVAGLLARPLVRRWRGRP